MGYWLLKLGCGLYPAEVAFHHHPSFFGFRVDVFAGNPIAYGNTPTHSSVEFFPA